MSYKIKALPTFILVIFSIGLFDNLFILPNNSVYAADGKLTNQKAQEAVWRFLKGHADKVEVTGVWEVPQVGERGRCPLHSVIIWKSVSVRKRPTPGNWLEI